MNVIIALIAPFMLLSFVIVSIDVMKACSRLPGIIIWPLNLLILLLSGVMVLFMILTTMAFKIGLWGLPYPLIVVFTWAFANSSLLERLTLYRISSEKLEAFHSLTEEELASLTIFATLKRLASGRKSA